jgi:ribose 5-phosphate isomerase A
MRLKQEPQLHAHFVATSRKSEVLARSLNLDLDSPPAKPDLDWGFDGADEVEKSKTGFRLIKGGGGAHTIEKRIARRCKKWICIVDESKLVKKIGAFPVAVEVTEETLAQTAELFIQKYGAVTAIKREGFITDKGNCILDVQMQPGAIQVGWEKEWNEIPGVIENGIFDDVQPTEVLVSHANGTIEIITPSPTP